MVMRKTVGQFLDQQNEKKEYFNSKYSFSKVTGLKEGMEVYCIPLNLESGLYEVAKHRVKARGAKQGFKGWFDANIKCKGVNDDGTENEGCICCQLAQDEYDKYPDSNDSGKRMISFKSYTTYIPVLILGCVDSAKGSLKVPPNKLTLKNYQFSYLEMASTSFQKEILTPFVNKLKEEGTISYEAEGAELNALAMEHLQKTIIKVTANHTDKKLPYERSYSFIPFTNQNIGAESGQYKYITQYDRVKNVHNDIVDYITMFDIEVDNLCKDWTEEELLAYINGSSRKTQATPTSTAPSKAEQVVTVKEEDIPTEEEMEMDDEDFGEMVDDPEVTTSAVPDTFSDIDDSELQMDVDEEFFLDDEQE